MKLLLASLVAGLATTPYAAFHFHSVTPYGVLANLAAMPVVSALVMPAGLLGLAAMPFGLDGFFWSLMGIGIDWMIVVTEWVANLPGAIGRMAAFGVGPMIAASCGLILMGLLRTPLRCSGALVLAVSIVWALAVRQPDILISGDGHNVAARGKDGRLHLMRTAKDAFMVKEWLPPTPMRVSRQTARLPTASHAMIQAVLWKRPVAVSSPGASRRCAGGRLRARGAGGGGKTAPLPIAGQA